MPDRDQLLLAMRGLKKHFVVKKSMVPAERKVLRAVDGVNLDIWQGETVGLVGESGCGKSTLGRTLLGLYPATDGSIVFKGKDIVRATPREMHELRKDMQMIFQDPYASLNPRMTILDSVKASLDVYKIGTPKQRVEKAAALLEYVGLKSSFLYKTPQSMSGGQRQRVVIARAIIMEPSFVVCDEPVSALDVSVQAQVLNLMKRIQKEKGLSYLFISHDLSVVRYLCTKVAVMYLGRIVEIADKKTLFENPLHPYTKTLLSAIPIPDAEVKSNRIILQGDLPSPVNPPSGCRFHTRCPFAKEECSEVEEKLKEVAPGHFVSCFRAKEFA